MCIAHGATLACAQNLCDAARVTEQSTDHVLSAIHEVLEAQGISRRELSRRTGWGRMRTQYLLNGTTRLTVADLQQIAAALDVPMASLIPADDQPAEVTS